MSQITVEVPDLVCVRCSASTATDNIGTKKTADGHVPLAPTRPDGWIAGPVDLADCSRGLCPRCAIDWQATVAAFVVAPAVIAELEPVRQHQLKPCVATLIPHRKDETKIAPITLTAPERSNISAPSLAARPATVMLAQRAMMPTSIQAPVLAAPPIIGQALALPPPTIRTATVPPLQAVPRMRPADAPPPTRMSTEPIPPSDARILLRSK